MFLFLGGWLLFCFILVGFGTLNDRSKQKLREERLKRIEAIRRRNHLDG